MSEKSIYEDFETNRETEVKGIVIDYGGGRKFLVARAGGANSRFARILATKMRPHRRMIDARLLDESVAERLLVEAFAETVVLGWENIVDKQKNPILFSRENCVKLFLDLPDLFADLREQAMKMSNFLEEETEAEAKNS